MNGYAPNSSSGGGGAAALSAGLLARKGEAFPAVDAAAHEGIDIAMRPMRPANSDGAPTSIGEDTIGSLNRERDAHAGASNVEPFPVRPKQASFAFRAAAPPQARSWSIIAPPKAKRVSAQRIPHGAQSMKAAVKFRMSAREFIRLRLAARDLEMSPQSLLLEALECYLDANDFAPLSDETYQQEMQRLFSRIKTRRK